MGHFLNSADVEVHSEHPSAVAISGLGHTLKISFLFDGELYINSRVSELVAYLVDFIF